MIISLILWSFTDIEMNDPFVADDGAIQTIVQDVVDYHPYNG